MHKKKRGKRNAGVERETAAMGEHVIIVYRASVNPRIILRNPPSPLREADNSALLLPFNFILTIV